MIKVLHIPSWYKTMKYPHAGIFYFEQAKAINNETESRILVLNWFRFKEIFAYFKNGGRKINTKKEGNISHYYINIRRLLPGNLSLEKNIQYAVERFVSSLEESDWKPDIIHLHSVYPAGKFAGALSKQLNIPYIVSEQRTNIRYLGSYKSIHKQILQTYNEASDRYAVSEALKEDIQSIGITKNIQVIPNFINTNFFLIHNQKTESPQIKILCIAALMYKKGIDILLKSFAKVLKNHPNLKLTIAGDGPDKKLMLQLSNELQISGSVDFLGNIDRDQVQAQLRDCDFFILPSRKETFGIVVIEALACGKPVLATRCGGPEFILNEATGILADPDKVDDLEEALYKMIQNYKQYKPEILRKYVKENFSEEVVVKRIIRIYENVINSKLVGESCDL